MNQQLDREMDNLLSDLNSHLKADFPNAKLHHRTDDADTVTAQLDGAIRMLEGQIEALLIIRRRL